MSGRVVQPPSSKMDDIFERIAEPVLACTICMQQEDLSATNVDSVYSEREFMDHIHDTHPIPNENGQSRASRAVHCQFCHRRFRNIGSHFIRFHSKQLHRCRECGARFLGRHDVLSHAREEHDVPLQSGFRSIETAFNRRVQTFNIAFPPMLMLSIEQSFDTMMNELNDLLLHQLAINNAIRFSLIVFVQYRRENALGGLDEKAVIPVRSAPRDLHMGDAEGNRMRNILSDLEMFILNTHDRITTQGSNWRIDYVTSYNVEIGSLDYKGGCGSRQKTVMKHVPKLKRKYVCNVPTPDPANKDCFFHSIAMGICNDASLIQDKKNRFDVAKEILRVYGVKTQKYKTPFRVKYARSFERRNSHLNIAINIYKISEERAIRVYKSCHTDLQERKIINLLLVNETVEHFMYITNLNAFLRPDGRKRFACPNCVTMFTRESALKHHVELCIRGSRSLVLYPQEGEVTEFCSYDKMVQQPIIGVLDFEACLEPISRTEQAFEYMCENCFDEGPEDQCSHATTDIHRQVPTTYSVVFVDIEGKILLRKTETCQNYLMEIFFITMEAAQQLLIPRLQRHRYKSDYTQEEEKLFAEANVCYICQHPFLEDNKSVRDHCHYTNKYLGAAHSSCNLRRRMRAKIPVFVHNFRNYDSHFIIKALSNKQELNGIAANMEKFRTLTVDKLAFVDSAELLPSGLADLVDTARASNHGFEFLDQLPFCTSPKKKELLLSKGIYPYEWANSVDKLKMTKSLPPKDAFYSQLNQSGISDSDYEHAQKVFKVFECKNMLDYCELYCTLDTILLLEVLTNFRKKMYSNFKLDVANFMSLPQLAFTTMLLVIKTKIERMSDPDMILMCEQNIRGGVSFVNVRHSDCRGENVLNDDFIQNHNFYVDATNLYSVAQVAYLPVGDFKWLTEGEILDLHEKLLNVSDTDDTGYILCVDLEYPKELHDKHSSMPLAPEQMDITFEDLSPHAQASLIAFQGEERARKYKSRKLCTTLTSKYNYVVHYRSLKYYLQQGMKLVKIHRAFSFRQAPVIKEYIDLCTEERKKAKTKDDKDRYKRLCNTNYGKLIEDKRRHITCYFCTTENAFDHKFRQVWYKGHRIINELLTIVYWEKKKIKMDCLYAMGFTILEDSKLHMYKSWYDHFQPSLGGHKNVSIVLTDTDSLVLQVKNMSRNQMLDAVADKIDFSNYPRTHPRFSEHLKAVPGYFKDENAGNILTEVVGLKSKCYIQNVLAREGKSESSSVVCKGIGKRARKNLTLDAYRSCIYNFRQVKTIMYCIRSKNHKMYTQRVNKTALSTTDDKRYLLDCGIHTLPHGHYKITEANNNVKCAECN